MHFANTVYNVFTIILTTNCHYFPTRLSPIGLSNGNTLDSLWGTNWCLYWS